MNIKKIEQLIKKEETEFFNSKKDYSEFSKYFTFKRYFSMNGDSLPFFSFILAVSFMPLILRMHSIFFSSFSFTMGIILSLGSIPVIFFIPIFISYFFHKFNSRKKFLKTQKDSKSHEAYIKQKLQPFFDNFYVDNHFINILKKELSDEQFILLNMDYPKPSYEELKKWLNKQIEIQKIKDVKKHEKLNSRDIKKYNKKNIKLNTI